MPPYVDNSHPTPVAAGRSTARLTSCGLLIRRLRGALLRLAFNRPAAFIAGLSCFGGAAWLAIVDAPWESWISDGAGLVAGATGAALILVALGGRRPDWQE